MEDNIITHYDISGKRYGKLTAVEYDHRGKYRTYWKCVCDCGNMCVVSRQHLTSGKTTSCGCKRRLQAQNAHKSERHTKTILSGTELLWLQTHYKHTKNVDIMNRLSLSEGTLHRLARKYGLTKTSQFMRKTNTESLKAAKESHERNHTYPPKGYQIPNRNSYQLGHDYWDTISADEKARIHQKSTESRNKTIALERARVNFGLDQKTKMKVFTVPRYVISQRYRLKKLGYQVVKNARIAYILPSTERHLNLEQKYSNQHKWRFYDRQSELERNIG